MDTIGYHPLESVKSGKPYSLEGFSPIALNREFLHRIGVLRDLDKAVIDQLESGANKFRALLESGTLTAPLEFRVSNELLKQPLSIHNYTSICPQNVFELNPSSGACSLSCLYCLVNDGNQREQVVVHMDYPSLVRQELENHKNSAHFFYFSPKVDAFSEPLLVTGVAHSILEEFVRHYDVHPDSKVRLFIASKAGPKQLFYQKNNTTILDLLEKIGKKVQFNGSVGIMPDCLREVLEPNAPSVDDRINAIRLCQERGIYARSVLAQPVIACYVSDSLLDYYFKKISSAGIENIKPEFLTVNFENLAIVAQYINHFDPEKLAPFLNEYIAMDNRNHVKQRNRTAPSRALSALLLEQISNAASKYGISISLCNWVASQVHPDGCITAKSASNGFVCLGYQKRMFEARNA